MRRLRDRADKINRINRVDRTNRINSANRVNRINRVIRCDTLILKDSFNPFIIINNVLIYKIFISLNNVKRVL